MKDILNTWYCCQPDPDRFEYFELCKIKREKIRDEHGYRYDYLVVTYYDGKELFRGGLKECKEWINKHWVERRYLDQYGKEG